MLRRPIIEFACEPRYLGVIPEPKPAMKCIPDWFKKIPQELKSRDQFGAPAMTAKKCLPMVDAMSIGYVIPLVGDSRIMTNANKSIIKAHNPPLFKTIEFHGVEQLGGKTSPTYPGNAVKFLNPWVIKTAPGWSILILPAINHIDAPFTCLSGLVDTDKYHKQINFPAIWHVGDYDDTLPAGTPLVTVIPVKRNTLPKNPIVRALTKKEELTIEKMHAAQQSRNHYYTKELRDPR